jgi:hypothetical protein
MQGPLWIELAKEAPDIFWKTHEKLLRDLADVAVKREVGDAGLERSGLRTYR